MKNVSQFRTLFQRDHSFAFIFNQFCGGLCSTPANQFDDIRHDAYARILVAMMMMMMIRLVIFTYF